MDSIESKRPSSFKVLLVFVCVLLIGGFLVPRLPVKLVPQNDLPSLTIYYSMNTATSRVIEMEVTSRLEGMLSRIKGIQTVSSVSDNGRGSVSIQISKQAEVDVVRFEISNAIRQLYPLLPNGVTYPVLSAKQADENASKPFLTYTINAPTSPNEIQQFAERNIRRFLVNQKGVDRVELNGASAQVWKLEYDSRQLKQHQLTESELQNALQIHLNSENLGMGKVEALGEGTDTTSKWIRLVLASQKSDEVFDASKILVANRNGKIFRLNELVCVTREDTKSYQYYRINGLNSIYLTIHAKEDANQLKLAKTMKQQLAALQAKFPPNYEIHLAYDSTEYIRDQLNKILFRSGLTVLLLLSFIFLIYRNSRYVLMITCSLAGSLALSVMLYNLVGLDMHLYSFMGLTISLNLMMDNIIVMADQIHRQGNRRAFLAILASTLSTMAALAMIFFMDERIKLNLQDLALVIVLNLAASLLVVLFLVPALIERLVIGPGSNICLQSGKLGRFKRRRRLDRLNKIYSAYIRFATKRRVLVLVICVLLFGLPVFMLPSELGDKTPNKVEKWYNETLGSTFYREQLKPVVDLVLGGSLRLFVQKVYQGSYWRDNEETSIYVSLSMPNGATLEQADFLIQKMENHLRKFKEIKHFQATINSRKSGIDIRFTNEHQKGSFPFSLRNDLINKAVELGGGSWGVTGVGDGFSNNLYEETGPNQLMLKGYNYDELNYWAGRIRDSLLSYRRIKEVTIDSRFSYYKDNYEEFVFDLHKNRLAEAAIYPQAFYEDLNTVFRSDDPVASWVSPKGIEPILFSSRQSKESDIWMLKHEQSKIGTQAYRVADMAVIERYQAPQSIVRENQQYQLCLQYEYIGAYQQARAIQHSTINKFDSILPVGYDLKVVGQEDWNNNSQSQPYWLLLVILGIIYFTTSILFNSMKQPLAILLLIPIAFVGLFLTFYAFKLNFDQGGFAAFVLLSGITVNAGIYVVNQYNQFRKNGHQNPVKVYVKAFNYRIIPVTLTVLATILGFIPFLIGEKEGFWFPLAAGVIGGLVFSMLGLIFFLPAFLGLTAVQNKSR